MKMKAVFSRPALQIALIIAVTANVYAQDPVLPPTNLGLANVYDGIAGKPGFVYQGYLQAFQTHAFYDQGGNRTSTDLKVNSLLQMNQLLYLSSLKVLGGNLGFTVLVPIVQISSTSATGSAPTTNPGVPGDPIEGTAIQWSDKKLFGKPFSHRLEFDVSVPLGNFDNRYEINPSAHLWSYEMYYAVTIIFDKNSPLSRKGHKSSSGRETKVPSGFWVEDNRGARLSSGITWTSHRTGPGVSRTARTSLRRLR